MIPWIRKILPFLPWPARAHRIRPLEGSRIRFVLKQNDLQLLIPIVNLSRTGIGLLSKTFPRLPTPGETLQGDLIVDMGPERLSTPLCLKIVHHQGETLGCQPCTGCECCRDDSPESKSISELKSIAFRSFRAEIEAMEMKPIPRAKLRKFQDGEPHWFFGSGDCELFYIVKEERLVRFQLSFVGDYFEGEMRDSNLRYAKKTEESGILNWQTSIPEEKILEARRFLAHIPGLAEPHRLLLQSAFNPRLLRGKNQNQ